MTSLALCHSSLASLPGAIGSEESSLTTNTEPNRWWVEIGKGNYLSLWAWVYVSIPYRWNMCTGLITEGNVYSACSSSPGKRMEFQEHVG